MNYIQENLIAILNDIDVICRENDIDYMLAAGGALGLIRQGGFLPWDDDIDIYMTRKNWNKFKVVAENYLKDDRLLVYNDKFPSYANSLPRYCNLSNCYIPKSFLSRRSFCGQNVEIFIFDPLPNDEDERKTHIKYLKIYTELMSDFFVVNALSPKRQGEFDIKLYKKYKFLASIFGKQTILKQLEKKISNVAEEDATHFIMCWTIKTYIFKKEYLLNTKNVVFEGTQTKVSAEPRKLLRDSYGDSWLIVPEQENQVNHANICYNPKYSSQDIFDEVNKDLPSESKMLKVYKKRKKYNMKNLFYRETRSDLINEIIAKTTIADNSKVLDIELNAINNLIETGKLKQSGQLINKYITLLCPTLPFGKVDLLYYNKDFNELLVRYYLKTGEYYTAEKQLNLIIENEGATELELNKYFDEIQFSRELSVAMYDELDRNKVKTILANCDLTTSLSLKAELWLLRTDETVDLNIYKQKINQSLKYNNDDGEFIYNLGCLKKLTGEDDYLDVLQSAVDNTRNGLVLYEVKKVFGIIPNENKQKEVSHQYSRNDFLLEVQIIFDTLGIPCNLSRQAKPKNIKIYYSDIIRLRKYFNANNLPFVIEDHIINPNLLLSEAYIINTEHCEITRSTIFKFKTQGIKLKLSIISNTKGIHNIKMNLANALITVNETKIDSKIGFGWFIAYKLGEGVQRILLGNQQKKIDFLINKFYVNKKSDVVAKSFKSKNLSLDGITNNRIRKPEFYPQLKLDSNKHLNTENGEMEYIRNAVMLRTKRNKIWTEKLPTINTMYPKNLTPTEFAKIIEDNDYLNKSYISEFHVKKNMYLKQRTESILNLNWSKVTYENELLWKRILRENKLLKNSSIFLAKNSELNSLLDYMQRNTTDELNKIIKKVINHGVESEKIKVWYQTKNDRYCIVIVQYNGNAYIYCTKPFYYKHESKNLLFELAPENITANIDMRWLYKRKLRQHQYQIARRVIYDKNNK